MRCNPLNTSLNVISTKGGITNKVDVLTMRRAPDLRAIKVDGSLAAAYNNLGIVHKEMAEWSEAVMTFQKAAELDMFLHEAHFNLLRALYYRHRGDLGAELVQSLIERLQMIMCVTLGDATGQLIHQRVEGFFDFLASTL